MQTLRSNPRIDGLYLFITTSTPELLSERQRQRLSEAASTLSKRLAWAKQQMTKSSTPGLFDNIITNTSLDDVSSLVLFDNKSRTGMTENGFWYLRSGICIAVV